MRTTLRAPVSPRGFTETSLGERLAAKLGSYWATYITWRVEQAAIAQLRSLTDRELKDIGLHRSEIFSAIRNPRARGRRY
jgi:uncharacterized protein YjiS (DUF1127 family)